MVEVLLLSGGVDSIAAWFYLNKPKCIYVDMKTKYSEKEKECIKDLQKIIPDLKVTIIEGINLGQFEEGEKAFIPHRNLILAAIGSNYGDRIIIAGIEDDVVEDKSPEAFKIMTECLNSISKPGKNVVIDSPFWEMSKSEIIKWMLKNIENTEEILRTSISCYSLEDGQCGNCPSCLRKAIAMTAAGLKVDFYNKDVRKSLLVQNYITTMKQTNKYTDKRKKESLEVFKKWGWHV